MQASLSDVKVELVSTRLWGLDRASTLSQALPAPPNLSLAYHAVYLPLHPFLMFLRKSRSPCICVP